MLRKLYLLGFRGPFYDLLNQYLCGRFQVVATDNHSEFSTPLPLLTGVPQGSILSPLLFNLYMNDFPSAIAKCKVFQYADDTVLLSKHLNYGRAVNVLQSDINNAVRWFSQNRITINSNKTKMICFRNPLKTTLINIPVYLHDHHHPCQCNVVEYVEYVKYLGIFFDCALTWQHHLSYVCGKLRKVACVLFNMKTFVPMHVKKSIAHALAYSVLRYGITIFGSCSSRWKTRVDSVLKNILKSIAYGSPMYNSTDIFKALYLPSFDSLVVQTVVTTHFWESDFKVENKPVRFVRSQPRFVVPRSRTRYGTARRCVYVAKIFNELPEEIFSASSKRQLKKTLNDYMVQFPDCL